MDLPRNFNFTPAQLADFLMYCFIVASLIGLLVHTLQILKYQREPESRNHVSIISWALWTLIWSFGGFYYTVMVPTVIAGYLPLINVLLNIVIAGYALIGHLYPVTPEQKTKPEVEYLHGYEKVDIANKGLKVAEIIEKAWPCKKGEKIEHMNGFIHAPFDGIAIISNKTEADIPRFVTIKQYQAIRTQKVKPISR